MGNGAPVVSAPRIGFRDRLGSKMSLRPVREYYAADSPFVYSAEAGHQQNVAGLQEEDDALRFTAGIWDHGHSIVLSIRKIPNRREGGMPVISVDDAHLDLSDTSHTAPSAGAPLFLSDTPHTATATQMRVVCGRVRRGGSKVVLGFCFWAS